MSWSTELTCNVSYNRCSYNSREEVESDLEERETLIKRATEDLRDLAMMTEPSKFCNKDDDPYQFVHDQFRNAMELLEEALVDKYKLTLLLYNWDKCHNEEGLAINPPEGFKWDTAYLTGEYVKAVKHPKTDTEL